MSYFCYQGNDHDCGFASLKMLLAMLSKDKNYLFLKKGSHKKGNYSLYDLIKIGEEHNLKLEAYKVDFFGLLGMKTPFLAMLKDGHMVLVKTVKKKYIVIHDPAEGIKRIKIASLDDEKTYYVLGIIFETEIDKCSDRRPVIMPWYRNLAQYVLTAAMGIILMLGFYFLNDDASLGLVIAFLAIVVISELVENWYLIKNILYFDKKYLPLFFKDEKARKKERYEEYIEYKKSYFGTSKSLTVSTLLVLVFSTLLILNDYKNLMVIILILFARVVDLIIFANKDDATSEEINKLETQSFKCKDNFVDNLLKANSKANGYASRLSARKCINVFLIAVFAILMMIINGLNSANYVLFHFGVYYVISNSFGNITLYISNFKKLRRLSARFIDSCNL